MGRTPAIVLVLLCVGAIAGGIVLLRQRQPAPAVAVVPDDDSVPPPRPSTRKQPTQAITDGVNFLISRQSEDGAWRSDVYATFKDGTALTPFAITAIQEAQDAGVQSSAANASIRKGLIWLSKLSKKDGTIDPGPEGLDYPMYTAALAIKAYSHVSAHDFLVARDGWVKYLKDRQLTEKLGWKPTDKEYGGWGYCRVIPAKPDPGMLAPSLIESNLSATVFALDALKAAGDLDDNTAKIAATFVRRRQNLDGGFHFIYDDPTRNKGGLSSHTPPVVNSYASATADGLRALTLITQSGERKPPFDPMDNDRRDSAADWLVENFAADTHPGRYVPAHEPNREAVYYYYASSAARALRSVKVQSARNRDWADEMSRELVSRQKPDGSWVNPVELVRENDPIVATCSAISALATCITPKP